MKFKLVQYIVFKLKNIIYQTNSCSNLVLSKAYSRCEEALKIKFLYVTVKYIFIKIKILSYKKNIFIVIFVLILDNLFTREKKHKCFNVPVSIHHLFVIDIKLLCVLFV